MRARSKLRSSSILVSSFAYVAATTHAGAAGAADPSPSGEPASPSTRFPSVPSSNVAAPNAQAPASAPARSTANFPTGLVERLPSSAYPEPYPRGIYGGSMWLNMQGLQWPYYPRTGIGLSGYAWIDNDYKLTRVGDPGQSDHNTKYFQEGRFLLRVTPTYSNGEWFVQAQGEVVANKNQLDTQATQAVVDAEDVWLRAGEWQKWDVMVGRFEAFEVYHLGMGLDINTDERKGAYDASHKPPDLYGATFLFYRPAGPGNAALHLYPTKSLRIELLGQWGNDSLLNYLGGRPAVVYDAGWIKAKAAAEYQWGTPQDPAPGKHNERRFRGVAGSVQFVLMPWLEFGPNIGYSVTDVFTPSTYPASDTNQSGNETSFGGFANAQVLPSLLVGAGANYATFSNLHQNAQGQFDTSTNTQYFVAVQYLLFNQLFIKLVGGYAKSHFESSFSNMNPYNDDMLSLRLRLMYLY
jgi:hypothetical protein